MARLQTLRVYDPVLSQVALGYTNAQLIGGQLFPTLPNMKRGGQIVSFGKEAFKIYNTLRATRAKAVRADWALLSPVILALEDHALEVPVDDSEIEEAIDPIVPESAATIIAQEAIAVEKEKKQADLAQTLGTYNSSNRVTLSGTAQWSDFVNSDPVNDVQVGREAIRAKIGRYPNTLWLGPIVYTKLSQHPKLYQRFQYTLPGGIITPQLLAQVFNIDKVIVGQGVYSDAAGNFTDLWGKHAGLAWVPPGAGRYIPSFGYTPQLQGRPRVLRYREEPNLNVVYDEDVYQVVVTAKDAGYFIQNAVA